MRSRLDFQRGAPPEVTLRDNNVLFRMPIVGIEHGAVLNIRVGPKGDLWIKIDVEPAAQ